VSDDIEIDALKVMQAISDPGLEKLPDGPARDLLSEIALHVVAYDNKTYTLVLRGETK
jgi:hypothetical protein